MARIKLEFENADGQSLAGLLETPPDGIPVARYALFAHCFTCGKDIAAASRISRAIASRGIALEKEVQIDTVEHESVRKIAGE